MSNFFKSKGKLIGLLMACMLVITGATVVLSQNFLGNDVIKGSKEESLTEEESSQESQEEEPELPPEEVEISFRKPESMRGAFLTPGKEFLTDPEDDTEKIESQVAESLESAKKYNVNTIIVDPRYEEKVIYKTADAAMFSDEDILELIVSAAKEEGFYVYSVFDLSDYKNGTGVTTLAVGGGEFNALAENAKEFAGKYELDGILLDGYQNEMSESSYGLYAKIGSAMGFDNFMRQNPELMLRNAAKVIREAKPDVQVGLMADPVWANVEQSSEGSETKAEFTSLVSANADTKGYLEAGLMDFVLVKALGSTTDKSEPFEEVVTWWGDLAVQTTTPVYIMQGSSLAASGEAGWGSDQLAKQAEIISNESGIQGNVFDSLSKLAANPGKSTDALMKYYDEGTGEAESGESSAPAIESSTSSSAEESSKVAVTESSQPASKPAEPAADPAPAAKPQAEKVALSRATLSLTVGGNNQLKATVEPATANQEVDWSSSDRSIAKVDGTGKVTGVKKGTATITAKASSGKISSCVVTVTEVAMSKPAEGGTIEDIVLSKDSVTLAVKSTVELDYAVYPSESTNQIVNWSSSDEKVATVSAGKITGVAKGTATITAKSGDGKTTATCAVTVTDSTGETGPSVGESDTLKNVTYISVVGGKEKMYINSNQTLSVEDQDEKAISNSQLIWESSDKSIATVDSNGVVTAKRKAGVVDIYVHNKDESLFDYWSITVSTERIKVTKINLNNSEITVQVGKKNSSLKATVEPTNATVNDLEWRIVNSSIASVDSKGVITGKKRGSTTLVVKASGSVQATCRVEVTDGLTINSVYLEDDFEMWVDDETVLVAELDPSGTDAKLIWTSSSPTTATVDSSGKVTAKRKGIVTITAKVEGKEECYDTCKITVV